MGRRTILGNRRVLFAVTRSDSVASGASRQCPNSDMTYASSNRMKSSREMRSPSVKSA